MGPSAFGNGHRPDGKHIPGRAVPDVTGATDPRPLMLKLNGTPFSMEFDVLQIST